MTDDFEPLGEDVSTHTVMGFHRHPEDDRMCAHHSRLASWCFGWPMVWRCLRDHTREPETNDDDSTDQT